MDPTLDFIYQRQGKQQELLLVLHELLCSFPNVTSKIRYKIPFYYGKSWFCYLNPVGSDQVELAFTRGNELSNEQGMLDFRGRKQVAGILFSSLDGLENEALLEVIQEALLLDETLPYNRG